MPRNQWAYWCSTSFDPNWDPTQLPDEDKERIRFIVWKPENLPHCGWHQHAYVEFAKPCGGKAVSQGLGQKVKAKGDSGQSERNLARKGTQAEAIGYVASDEWCRNCHTGDCRQATWLFDAPYNLPAWISEDHAKCREQVHKEIVDPYTFEKHTKYKCELKGTCGELQQFGTPIPQGSGGKREGSGSGQISQTILDAIKGGAGYAEICDKHNAWVSGHNSWVKDMVALYALQPSPSIYTLEEMCDVIRENPVDFDDPDWQHSAVVMGNPGCGKTNWAKAHFKAPLVVSHNDDLKGFDPNRFDGIVFDDLDFKHMPRQAQIYLTDWCEARSVHCRNFNGRIPARTRKIFTCNWDCYPFIDDGAINRRVVRIETDRDLPCLVNPLKPRTKRKVLKAVDDRGAPEPKRTKTCVKICPNGLRMHMKPGVAPWLQAPVCDIPKVDGQPIVGPNGFTNC